MKEIYFDNAATTRVRPEVIELMDEVMGENYGNPSSRHILGVRAENYIKTAAGQIAATLKVKPQEIVFNSGGTEGNNMALIGTALARKGYGKHIISTNIEHAAVYKPLELLESLGFEVSIIGTDSKGHVDMEALKAAIRKDTILVSSMWVNNEMGAIEDIAAMGRLIKEANPRTYFHSDAIQAYGKLTLRPKEAFVDMMTVSAHKIHGPKGAGFIYINEKAHVDPTILGGGQQKDRRSGTENVPGIAGTGLAAELYKKEHAAIESRMLEIKDRLTDRLNAMEGVTVNSEKGKLSAPHIVSASFDGVRAEVLLHALEEKGIYVSSGSACSSNHPAISGTLKAIGVKNELLDSTLRFSFGIYNEPEEADEAADCISELLPQLRRFRRY
ncbi:MAG: cysteine desulfurase family protein [Eubacteriales bacterium]|nr:cysteine desulfurase family protein [Eubacteriales bacterium]